MNGIQVAAIVKEAGKVFAAVKADGGNLETDSRIAAANAAIRLVYPACKVDARKAHAILFGE